LSEKIKLKTILLLKNQPNCRYRSDKTRSEVSNASVNRSSSVPVDLDHIVKRDPVTGTSRKVSARESANNNPGEVAPLQRPGKALESIITVLSDPKSHWETMIESLVQLRALATFHQEVFSLESKKFHLKF
jgi:hypothetical protein